MDNNIVMICSVFSVIYTSSFNPSYMEHDPQIPIWHNITEVELIYKSTVKPSERPIITTSRDSYAILLQIWSDTKINLLEEFKVLFLNNGNRVLGCYHLSTGGVTGTIADPRLIFTAALKVNACAVILSHNHPSGSLKPSRQDEEITLKMKHAGQFLDIKVLDHIIMSSEDYFSFADEGLL
jgi:DNA repair protein RadC